MKFTINREKLLVPLQLACGVVEKRQTAPVLSNLLLVLEEGHLVITGTDQELEMTVRIPDVSVEEAGEVTVPARKLMDICKSLPDGADMRAELNGNRVSVESGRFSSHLATLPVTDFPDIEPGDHNLSVSLTTGELTRLLARTSFAMAQQDVRFFFNGVLLDVQGSRIRFVATNGQRLATSYVEKEDLGQHQFIIPRKAVGELGRILGDDEDEVVQLNFTANHMQVERGDVILITKLIDATYPDYTRAIPNGGDKVVMADRQLLKEALSRTAILSNELYRNVRLMLLTGKLDLHANNPQQEEAEETLNVEYEGDSLEIGFNVSYLIETLSAMKGATVRLTLSDPTGACLLEDLEEPESLFVISPMVI
ncbi:MAG: DNA polymerase III subunit beta [Pseudomonadales bacterium]|nr:DNA polymerase III subunit beta [Pseudomonadales bacterium]MBO6656495.1 DNA polymerase III subunit beta [Pseudomonadales bacterium]MBO6703300.1 DNA polymerase III subunit beta [Pseudomonadales bacterium]MBO7006110.1 DNA polymerase III subunit beta [Pseudomonadales bacterium]